MNLESVVDWGIGIDKTRPPKKLDQIWIAGTPYFDQLTEKQKLEAAWYETARDVSMFIRLEQMLPPLYVGYLNQYGKSIPDEVYEYLMIFSKEEIVHTLMFQRYLKMANLPIFRPPKAYTTLIRILPQYHPCVGILYTLVLEWAAEMNAMSGTQSEEIDPLTKEMFRQHHLDEVRHIGFARRIVEDYFVTAPQEDLKTVRRMIRKVFPRLIDQLRYNPEISEHTSFVFPVAPDDEQAIATIRNSERYQTLDNARYKEMYAWLRSLELI